MCGYIKIYRSLTDHWLWQDGNEIKLKWWLSVLMDVNHSDKKINIGYEVYECKRGQSIKSLGTWAKQWRVTKKTVSHFFSLLEKDGMLIRENIGISTRLTICNYASYQDSVNDKETAGKREGYTNKNDKNVNNVNTVSNGNFIREPNIPTSEEVLRVFTQQGGLPEMAKAFYEKYEAVGWYKNGSPIKSFNPLVSSFIINWNKNLQSKNGFQTITEKPRQRFKFT